VPSGSRSSYLLNESFPNRKPAREACLRIMRNDGLLPLSAIITPKQKRSRGNPWSRRHDPPKAGFTEKKRIRAPVRKVEEGLDDRGAIVL